MADDDFGVDENTEEGAAPAKKGGGGFLPTLLKYIAIVIGAIVLIVTVVIITMNIMNKNGSGSSTIVPISEEYSVNREELDWYTSIGSITTYTADVPSANVVVEVVLGYKTDDKAASAEITKRQIEIKDYLRRYFSSKSKNELGVKSEDKLKMEIRNSINDNILSKSKIRDVMFLTLSVVE
ncbi:MAG: flagellar basal body-associated FliL family protein [Treponemataceae bacterium]|nr:flagellar basal body-associated FliL family protein [Treponemataceae bacterium]